jgi:hypothetical protein
MSEADILASTYEDRVTVYRAFKETLNGETVFQKGLAGKLICSDMPCALSGQSGGRLHRSASVASASADYFLYVRPEMDIQPNDYLEVSKEGAKILLVAGRAVRFPSHNCIPLTLDSEVV